MRRRPPFFWSSRRRTARRPCLSRLIAVIALLAGLAAAGCTLGRILVHNVAEPGDYRLFAARELAPPARPFRFIAADPAAAAAALPAERLARLEEFLTSTETRAFLAIRDDTLLVERYWEGYDAGTLSLSFSMAKAVTALLVGCAIEDGYLRGVDQPVTDFIPELAAAGFGAVRLEHLLQMTSGLAYSELDNPFGRHARLYYAEDMTRELLGYTLEDRPGRRWKYKSGDYQLLGLVLARALPGISIAEYTQRRLWTPLGMESPGLWSLDRPGGLEKTFCCLAATARDYAKLGRLMLRRGDWDGARVLPAAWVERMLRLDESEGAVWDYRYGWFRVAREEGDIAAQGRKGQYLYVHPGRGLVLVRLGEGMGGLDYRQWRQALHDWGAELSPRPLG